MAAAHGGCVVTDETVGNDSKGGRELRPAGMDIQTNAFYIRLSCLSVVIYVCKCN